MESFAAGVSYDSPMVEVKKTKYGIKCPKCKVYNNTWREDCINCGVDFEKSEQ